MGPDVNLYVCVGGVYVGGGVWVGHLGNGVDGNLCADPIDDDADDLFVVAWVDCVGDGPVGRDWGGGDRLGRWSVGVHLDDVATVGSDMNIEFVITQLLLLVVAGIAGSVVHEVSHYVVARILGRQCELDLPRIRDDRPTISVTFEYCHNAGDVIIAIAPIVVGSIGIIVGVFMAAPIVVIAGLLFTVKPSWSDVRLIRETVV